MTQCIVCNSQMHSEIADWHFTCQHCGYESASLEVAINSDSVHENVDERQRVSALQTIRHQNFSAILRILKKITRDTKQPNRLLDVGAAHGWFLEMANESFDILGIEPDRIVAETPLSKGIPIRIGFFPDSIEPAELFHVITFNDVIEHIPDIGDTLEACSGHLENGGLLALNLPSSTGVFYRLAKLLARLGASQFFDRMWQLGLPSPHVHYFNQKNLLLLLQTKGFSLIHSSELDSVTAQGLLERIRYTKNFSPALAYPIYWILFLSLPFLKLFSSDIVLMIFKFERRVAQI